MKPQQAQMRQQQAQNRRSRLQEIEAAAQMEAMRNPQLRQMQQQRHLHGPFGPRMAQQRRDPNRGLITSAEWNELVERREESGRAFRYFFWLAVIAAMLLLTFFKYDEEFRLEVPQIESGRGFGEVLAPESLISGEATQAAKAGSGQTISAAELEEYYRTLGVEGRLKDVVSGAQHDSANAKSGNDGADGGEPAAAGDVAARVDPDKQRRRDNYRVRKEIQQAYQQHQEKQGQLVHCGRSCEAKNQQIELAYNKLAAQVDRELFGVLLDAKDTKSARAATPAEMKRKYEEKRELIMKTEEDEEDRNMALEELKDAYDIIQNPEARRYYLLYGAKPPEYMRHVDARHGGWGQELALGTFKYRLIIAWLDFMHAKIGTWGETIVLLCVLVFVLSRLPVAMKQSQRLLDDMEWQEQSKEEVVLAQRRSGGTPGGGDGPGAAGPSGASPAAKNE